MSSSELEEFLEEHQNDRLRVVMSSGDEWVIEKPQRTMINGLSLYVQMFDNWATRVTHALALCLSPTSI